jgi:hypothetical protein
MKSFKEYLTESKKTYDFKVKVAGECPDECASKIKEALSIYDCANVSAGARTPIQETHYDFPEHKNIEVTVFDVSLNYPTTSPQIRSVIANKLDVTESCVIVRNPQEEAETVLNHANDNKEGSILDKPLEEVDGQKLVGDKHVTSFLKELSKTKTTGEQVKGTNDKILAKKAPSEKSVKVKTEKAGSTSPVGSRKVTLPTAKTAGGR